MTPDRASANRRVGQPCGRVPLWSAIPHRKKRHARRTTSSTCQSVIVIAIERFEEQAVLRGHLLHDDFSVGILVQLGEQALNTLLRSIGCRATQFFTDRHDIIKIPNHHFVPRLFAPANGLGWVRIVEVVGGIVEVGDTVQPRAFGKFQGIGEPIGRFAN